jgi:hypothetical protein
VAHCDDEVQLVGQDALVPRHRYGLQLGDPLPVTLVQVPVVHESHAPEHALLQQTPSTQLPEEHSTAAEQDVPLLFLLTQAVPLQ